ncbi:MAG: UbiX family flavin prenyltransferase [Bacteroidales bacterium]|nr:UbiX family flavin prenyltransferase [Bacteroidales bacterium]
MNGNQKRIIVAVAGASGTIYAKRLFEKLISLTEQIEEVEVVFSKNAYDIWHYELDNKSYKQLPFKIYDNNNFFAPFASGSAKFDTMIICPCSIGTLGRIANGISDDLISRAAEVILKERKKLIIVPRETPYSLITINNMKILTEAGGIICPANPSFYNNPQTINDLVDTVVNRVLDLAGFEIEISRWK